MRPTGLHNCPRSHVCIYIYSHQELDTSSAFSILLSQHDVYLRPVKYVVTMFGGPPGINTPGQSLLQNPVSLSVTFCLYIYLTSLVRCHYTRLRASSSVGRSLSYSGRKTRVQSSGYSYWRQCGIEKCGKIAFCLPKWYFDSKERPLREISKTRALFENLALCVYVENEYSVTESSLFIEYLINTYEELGAEKMGMFDDDMSSVVAVFVVN